MNRRPFRIFIIRLLLATMSVGGAFAALAVVHDYPQTRDRLRELRDGDAVMNHRRWIKSFYFFNEAGNGIKYMVTGNERYMRFFPSASHIVRTRTNRALDGDWRAQMALANMHFSGQYVPKNRAKTLHWLTLAQKNAPPEQRQNIQNLINDIAVDGNSI